MRALARTPVAACAFALTLLAGGSVEAQPLGPFPVQAQSATTPPVVIAAGDIACESGAPSSTMCHQKATSDRAIAIAPDAVLVLGDNQYERGQYTKYRTRYGPTWGRLKEVTYPVAGNHDYETPGARGYFRYFDRPKYYGFDLGRWHLLALDSEIAIDEGSRQDNWLEADLADADARCVLAYWHEPRFSSGTVHGSDPSVTPLWRDLYAARADVVLNGHEHLYERFAPMTPWGDVRYERGIRQFIVGTGGRSLYGFGHAVRGSLIRDSRHFGVLKLTLGAGWYRWAFVSEGGRTLDSGWSRCN